MVSVLKLNTKKLNLNSIIQLIVSILIICMMLASCSSEFPHCARPDYILFGKNLGAQRYRCQACLCAVSERFVDKLGSGNVELLDSCQRECSLDEHSEEIASLDPQILEITSFV
jgi:transposase-like protein